MPQAIENTAKGYSFIKIKNFVSWLDDGNNNKKSKEDSANLFALSVFQ